MEDGTLRLALTPPLTVTIATRDAFTEVHERPMPHAAPTPSWRHPWCGADCPLHASRKCEGVPRLLEGCR